MDKDNSSTFFALFLLKKLVKAVQQGPFAQTRSLFLAKLSTFFAFFAN
jgi:hypothetical protein